METNMAVISTEEFINLVAEQEALWRKSHPHFSNKDIRAKHLEELSEISGMTVNDCKKKLKNLKDTFRVNVAKLPKTSSGTPAFNEAHKITWPYFKNCLFMKDEITGRKMTSPTPIVFAEPVADGDESEDQNIGDMASQDSDMSEDNVTESNIPIGMSLTPLPEARASTAHSRRANALSRSRKRQRYTYDLEKEKLEILGEAMQPSGETVDCLRHFLLSLEDDMRSLSRHNLCSAKLEFMQVVNKFVEREHMDYVPQNRDERGGQSEPCGTSTPNNQPSQPQT